MSKEQLKLILRVFRICTKKELE